MTSPPFSVLENVEGDLAVVLGPRRHAPDLATASALPHTVAITLDTGAEVLRLEADAELLAKLRDRSDLVVIEADDAKVVRAYTVPIRRFRNSA